MTRLVRFVFITMFALITSCASLQSVSVTQIPKNRFSQVTASVEKLVILGINFDNNFINSLNGKLMNQCPNAKIQGIVTKYYTVSYLLFAKHRVEAKGYCV